MPLTGASAFTNPAAASASRTAVRFSGVGALAAKSGVELRKKRSTDSRRSVAPIVRASDSTFEYSVRTYGERSASRIACALPGESGPSGIGSG